MQDRIVIRSQRHGGQAIRTSVNIPRELRQWLRSERDRRHLSESAIVTEALRIYRDIIAARGDTEQVA
jgi:hypothetical protein